MDDFPDVKLKGLPSGFVFNLKMVSVVFPYRLTAVPVSPAMKLRALLPDDPQAREDSDVRIQALIDCVAIADAPNSRIKPALREME